MSTHVLLFLSTSVRHVAVALEFGSKTMIAPEKEEKVNHLAAVKGAHWSALLGYSLGSTWLYP